jgi:hypothetical protein
MRQTESGAVAAMRTAKQAGARRAGAATGPARQAGA